MTRRAGDKVDPSTVDALVGGLANAVTWLYMNAPRTGGYASVIELVCGNNSEVRYTTWSGGMVQYSDLCLAHDTAVPDIITFYIEGDAVRVDIAGVSALWWPIINNDVMIQIQEITNGVLASTWYAVDYDGQAEPDMCPYVFRALSR